ncbi:MAG: site-2 protease family protein [Bryobacteraceae bacterium]
MAAFGSPAQQLEELAIRARQLAAIGQLQAARDQWLTALQLLPSRSSQYRAVQREIEKIDARLNPTPKKTTDWKKRLGPLGILIAALIKFKTLALVLLTKGKFLISILAFVGVYWSLFGWWFAVGLSGSVLLHEMGHYFMVRRFGFSAELPMFLPGFGAYVKWNGANVDPGIRAQISLAGPLFGLISGLISYGIFLQTGHGVWLAVAHFAGWLNLLNLIPVLIFDGASAMTAVGMQGRLALLAVSLVMWYMLRENLFLFLAIGTGYRIWKRDVPAQPNEGIAYYFIGLAVANGFLSWFSMNRGQLLFPH